MAFMYVWLTHVWKHCRVKTIIISEKYLVLVWLDLVWLARLPEGEIPLLLVAHALYQTHVLPYHGHD